MNTFSYSKSQRTIKHSRETSAPIRVVVAISIFSSLIAITGCKDQKILDSLNNGPDNTPKVMMPLAVGNNWKYHEQSFNANGIVYYDGEYSIDIVGDTVIDGVTWFDSDPRSSFYGWANLPDGVWIDRSFGLGKWLLVKFPAEIGDSWKIGDIATVTLMAKDVKIDVPAGSYLCNQYEWRTGNLADPPSDVYWCPGVGEIQRIFRDVNSVGDPYISGITKLESCYLN